MDVTSLLNTAGSSSKPPRSSASPAITESGHTVPSSALPTPSPERTLGPADLDGSPRQNPSLWGARGYSLQLVLDAKARSSSVFSYQADGRAETESEGSLYNCSRNDSVCSAEVSASSHSPRNTQSRTLLSFISPEQSDGEHGGMEARNSGLASRSSQSAHVSTPHSRISSCTTIGALQSGKDATLQNRGTSLDRMASHRDSQTTSQADEGSLSLHSNGSKMHKRTMSAPDIAQCSVARMPRHSAQPIISESTCSRPGDEQSAEESRRSSAATETSASMKQDQEAYCMFVKDCDTGSQLRKAISHLFGRNKACTLRIPKHVWVYYCRKHYQRIRYRNAKTYPLNQMELVKLQIMRLQAWSEENRKQNNGAYIRMWTLSLRKREQSRIENGGGGGSVTEDSSAVHDARTMAGTAVPEWLIQRVASGYTTEAILDVAERLHKEIKDGHLAQVPEIEFLPDIVEADSGTGSKASRNGRRQSRVPSTSGIKTPKRKAPEALDFGRRDSVYSDGRGASKDYPHPPQHHYHHHHGHYPPPPPGEESYNVVSPSGKRARLVRGPPSYGPPATGHSAQLPPLASALSYGEMQPPPQATARAPNVVVPRIQPPAYRRGSHSYGTASPPDSYYPGQSLPGGGGPPRWDGGYESSPHSARSDGAYALSTGDFRHAGPPAPHHGQQQPLPPISAQLDSRFPRAGPHAGRPHHWRSASAYVPGDHRAPPMPGARPLSSGHDAPHHAPPPPGYGREYEQGPPPQLQHYGPEQHDQYAYAWPRGHHGSQPPPHAPRHAGPPGPHAEEAWSREGRVVYGGRP
ncbi:hypothetical protein CCM_02041 [Cordyceps militaris CM01]|uniref:ORP1 like protein n=1 Tax=Cordyceps militaris (strain CM01) TaxID=983644 RepID=G3JCA7_CORMM|nr:uncharacterized protein CCM_02041 [Cordyceps militaris CM01]EGX93772.1 hypothetical protein CCM_02041 [Cordyceps militaris CM01]